MCFLFVDDNNPRVQKEIWNRPEPSSGVGIETMNNDNDERIEIATARKETKLGQCPDASEISWAIVPKPGPATTIAANEGRCENPTSQSSAWKPCTMNGWGKSRHANLQYWGPSEELINNP